MKIILSEMAGFCFGVNRAINTIDKLIQKNMLIYTYGPIIHNPQVVEYYKKKGVNVVDDLSKIEDKSTLIIRTHGITKKEHDLLIARDINIIDRTCPFVKKVQKIVEEYYKKGYSIVIVGDANHPEIVGVNGWCDNKAYIVDNEQKAKNLDLKKACVVAQTTLPKSIWESILNVLKAKISDLVAFNTICDATEKRQLAAVELSKKVDSMIVVGGLNSANTKNLARLCKKFCSRTYHIETINQLPDKSFFKNDIIGITAGASTPDWILNQVINELNS